MFLLGTLMGVLCPTEWFIISSIYPRGATCPQKASRAIMQKSASESRGTFLQLGEAEEDNVPGVD